MKRILLSMVLTLGINQIASAADELQVVRNPDHRNAIVQNVLTIPNFDTHHIEHILGLTSDLENKKDRLNGVFASIMKPQYCEAMPGLGDDPTFSKDKIATGCKKLFNKVRVKSLTQFNGSYVIDLETEFRDGDIMEEGFALKIDGSENGEINVKIGAILTDASYFQAMIGDSAPHVVTPLQRLSEYFNPLRGF